MKKIHGYLNINKPSGVTSFQVIGMVRKATGMKKVGHAGTLDPLASGVLPVAIGEATKTISLITDATKSYEFHVKWGELSDTDDADGKIVRKCDKFPKKHQILDILPEFTGNITQLPPKYSAIKIGGKRACDIMRQGGDVEMKLRDVEILELSLTDIISETEAAFHVHCSKGTYVRSLARDIAISLGTFGHITKLVRTTVGNFILEDAISPENLQPAKHIIELTDVLSNLPHIDIDDASAVKKIRQGQKIKFHNMPDFTTGYITHENKVIAMGSLEQGIFHPKKVLNY